MILVSVYAILKTAYFELTPGALVAPTKYVRVNQLPVRFHAEKRTHISELVFIY